MTDGVSFDMAERPKPRRPTVSAFSLCAALAIPPARLTEPGAGWRHSSMDPLPALCQVLLVSSACNLPATEPSQRIEIVSWRAPAAPCLSLVFPVFVCLL